MNTMKLILTITAVYLCVSLCAGRAIRSAEKSSEENHSISKRSTAADVSLHHKNVRDSHILRRKLFLQNLIEGIDTSSYGMANTATSTYSQNDNGKWKVSERPSGKGKRRRGGRGKGNRRRGRKNSRRTRSLTNAVATLINSQYGDEILEHIYGVVKGSVPLSKEAQTAADIVEQTARKCECPKVKKD